MVTQLTRRNFSKLALAGIPLASAWCSAPLTLAQGKQNSRINGVQVGMITGGFGPSTGEFIATVQKIGFSELEVQSALLETMAGAPVAAHKNPDAGPVTLNANGLTPRCANMPMVINLPPSAELSGKGKPTLSPDQEAARARLWEWRNAATPETWKGVRKIFTDAGIEPRIMWASLGYRGAYTSDEDIDYAFRQAQGMGVRAISSASTLPIAKRIAPVAEEYKVLWGGHTSDNIHDPDQFSTPEAYEELLSLSPYFRINLDIGYFTAAGYDSVAFIQKHHAKITDIHLKDRKRSKSLGGDITDDLVNNWPFGQGDSPIKEVLQLLKKEKYDIPVNIEYEYACRTTNDAVTEITRAFEYVKKYLD